MQIIEKKYENHMPLYPIERFCEKDKALFVDIETTGLKKETTTLYLIGCGYYEGSDFITKLFFADNSREESMILAEFATFIRGFSHLFHFNGLKFDIPYLEYKAELYEMGDIFEGIVQTDIYKLCKPLRYLLFSESMRQKCIESFLGITRDDMYGGGELIEVYKQYEQTHNPDDLTLLVTHNREDVLGMHLIMPILYYLDLYDAPLSFEGYKVKGYCDFSGAKCEEVIFTYRVSLKLPVSFIAKTESMYVRFDHKDGRLSIRLPIITDDMKIYFDDYRDYCYIPEEDRAILKTIAITLPKDRYQRATRQNCYQRVSGKFLKQPSDLFRPVLKTSLKDKRRYFRFPDSFQKETADEFGRQLINVFFTMRSRRSSL